MHKAHSTNRLIQNFQLWMLLPQKNTKEISLWNCRHHYADANRTICWGNSQQLTLTLFTSAFQIKRLAFISNAENTNHANSIDFHISLLSLNHVGNCECQKRETSMILFLIVEEFHWNIRVCSSDADCCECELGKWAIMTWMFNANIL